MKMPWLSSFILSGFMVGSLAASVQPVGEWTVSDAHRTKSQNNTLCTWHFTVADYHAATNTSNIFDCDFNVTAASGSDCGVASFQDACTGNSSFAVNGGHSELGFVVVVLVNEVQGSQAYFGFSDGALDTASEIVQQTKPVYPQGITQQDEVVVQRQDSGNNTPSDTEWKVEDLFRGK
ncbi:hypothetical protein F4804DRAFT_319801 [Jackrogersella minutella]|nr:hypothetical protein F4804DRAFT_319801 [Jackrogersella minutella]